MVYIQAKHILKNERWRIVQLLISFFLLLTGGGIYVLFRSKSLLMFRWLDDLNMYGLVESARSRCAGMVENAFVLYNLPDSLWMIAYLLIVNAVVPKSNRRVFLVWTVLLPVLAVVYELLQAIHLIPGVFDLLDVLCYLVPLFIFLINFKFFSHEKENV